jgi:cytochrome c peroxidase
VIRTALARCNLAAARTTARLACAALVLTTLAACGGAGGDDGATPPTGPTALSSTVMEAPDRPAAPVVTRDDPAAGEWRWDLPAGWQAPKVPADNPMSVAKVALGRHLFHDDRLSGNGQFSCATCHQQSLGFGDARATPFGSTGQRLARNAQPLANVGWLASLTSWDPTKTTLEDQMGNPLFATAPVEMGVNEGNRDAVLARFTADADYRRMFTAAFPTDPQPIGWTNLVRAIAAFQRTLVSINSRFDRAERGETTLSDAERRGRELFFSDRTRCSGCHGGNTFAEPTRADGRAVETAFHNIGLYNVGQTGAYPTAAKGLIERTGVATDMGRFRTPSLRNVEVTGPYMHDGSVATLAEVIEIYARGGREVNGGEHAGDGRDNPFRSPLIRPLDLTSGEKADLLAFLRTLTDTAFLNDPALSNPFAAR